MVKIDNIELPDFPLLLAPMEDVSDPPFRILCKEQGANLVFTEFISSEGLIRNAEKSVQKLDIYDAERPIGIQIFGGELDAMLASTNIVMRTNPDIIDINYGCPVKKIVCKNAGAGILRDIPKMILLTKEIVKRSTIPVTVKTRLGWDAESIKIVEVAERLQDVGIKAISIHGRTRVQMYKGNACWNTIAKVKNNPRMHIPVFANGDINTPEKAKLMRDHYGFDGVMIGRASIGNPWFFKNVTHYLKTNTFCERPNIKTRVETCRKHLKMAITWKGEKLGIYETRKHYTNYFKGLKNIKSIRNQLVTANTPEKVHTLLDEIQANFSEQPI